MSRVVTCNAGFSANSISSFTATCSGTTSGNSQWTNVLTCLPVACSPVSIAFSDSQSSLLDGKTLDTLTVTCNNGYSSTAGPAFPVYCLGTGTLQSTWTQVLACNSVACPTLSVPNSSASAITGNTLDVRDVTCSNGYISSNGASFTVTCSGTAPGQSAWNVTLTCEGSLSLTYLTLFG